MVDEPTKGSGEELSTDLVNRHALSPISRVPSAARPPFELNAKQVGLSVLRSSGWPMLAGRIVVPLEILARLLRYSLKDVSIIEFVDVRPRKRGGNPGAGNEVTLQANSAASDSAAELLIALRVLGNLLQLDAPIGVVRARLDGQSALLALAVRGHTQLIVGELSKAIEDDRSEDDRSDDASTDKRATENGSVEGTGKRSDSIKAADEKPGAAGPSSVKPGSAMNKAGEMVIDFQSIAATRHSLDLRVGHSPCVRELITVRGAQLRGDGLHLDAAIHWGKLASFAWHLFKFALFAKRPNEPRP